MQRLFPRLLGALALGAALAAAGCSSKSGTVTGKVTYKGQPMANTQINFVPAQGYPVAAVTGPDGSYTVAGVAYGSSKVTLQSLDPAAASAREHEEDARNASGGDFKAYQELKKKGGKSAGKPSAPTGPQVPEKYREPRSTPLVHNVTAPTSSFDVTLQD